MQRVNLVKNGFTFRAVECKLCNERVIHPEDKIEYENYQKLRNKQFNVKLRMVGNSYTVSIPKEIVKFINEQNRMMNEMVKLSFERMGKLSLIFEEELKKKEYHG